MNVLTPFDISSLFPALLQITSTHYCTKVVHIYALEDKRLWAAPSLPGKIYPIPFVREIKKTAGLNVLAMRA